MPVVTLSKSLSVTEAFFLSASPIETMRFKPIRTDTYLLNLIVFSDPVHVLKTQPIQDCIGYLLKPVSDMFRLGSMTMRTLARGRRTFRVFCAWVAPAGSPGPLLFLCRGGAQPMHETSFPNRFDYSAKAYQNNMFGSPTLTFA